VVSRYYPRLPPTAVAQATQGEGKPSERESEKQAHL
jgi:hypothetical protein